VTAIGCFDDLILIGGQFGKVFLKSIKTKQVLELIDQAQAHKRKILMIYVTNYYIFTAGADQKVKQWTAREIKLVWTITWGYIPTSLVVSNDTIYLGGPSRVNAFTLNFFDKSTISHLTSDRINSARKDFSSQNPHEATIPEITIIVLIFVIVIIVVLVLLLIYKRSSKPVVERQTESSTQSAVGNEITHTLVTQILKIALPGYRELTTNDFRVVKRLAKGGGGEVSIGEALSQKSSIFGRQVIVKQFAGKIQRNSYVL
jgi:hypothetical protein